MHETTDNFTNESNAAATPGMQVTTYHRALLNYLQTQEEDLWKWFSSHQARNESADAVRLDLLKTAYRIDRESAADLYQLADSVAEKMGLESNVTLYQAQHAAGLNASLAWLPHDAHVVLYGPVQETLSTAELSALLAHELAHHELYTIDDGAYLVMEQVLSAMISDQAADAPHDRTWRSHRLYTELYCDRRAAAVTGDIDACVCALVKMETGLKEVSAAAYCKQAEEVLSNGLKGSEGITHPEMFLRAKALQLWHDDPDGADQNLRELIEGPLELKQLDLLRQQQMQKLTRQFLNSFLNVEWLRTDLVLGHAKRFFEGFTLAKESVSRESLKKQMADCDQQLRDYFCYVLLDFVTCDADLEEAPLAAAFLFSEDLGSDRCLPQSGRNRTEVGEADIAEGGSRRREDRAAGREGSVLNRVLNEDLQFSRRRMGPESRPKRLTGTMVPICKTPIRNLNLV